MEVEVEHDPYINWFKDDVIIDDGGRFIIEDAVEGDTLYRLTVNDSTVVDTGEYKCVASNDIGDTTCTVYVDVRPEENLLPEFIGSTTESPLNIVEGEDGKIDVEIRKRPGTTVVWYKNNIKLRRDRHVIIESKDNSYNLTVKKMMKSDAGIYKCVAICPTGKVSKEFQVNVICKCLLDHFIRFSIFS